MLAGNGRRLGSTNRTSPGLLSSFQPDGGRSVEPAAGPSIVAASSAVTGAGSRTLREFPAASFST